VVKRLLSALPSELKDYNKEELLESISLSEGRTILSEIIGETSLFRDVSNAETAAAFGADILLLNFFDFHKPRFENIEGESAENIIAQIKKLTGKVLGINLEPVSEAEEINKISSGRKANLENLEEAVRVGFDLVNFTGNPSVGVSNKEILRAVKLCSGNFGDQIIISAGKMHMSGIKEEYLSEEYINNLIKAGADIILLPAPGTVPGIDLEDIKKAIKIIHQSDKLALTAIGTSQESSEEETIREIALMSKMAGADIQHIGDAGYGGMAVPENILSLSKVIRGRRHTYRRMSISINR